MADLIPDKVAEDLKFTDLLMAGSVKYFGERALAPYIGNGTLMSGAIKIGAASMLKKQLPKVVYLAAMMDGTEDLLNGILSANGGLLSGLMGGGASAQSSSVAVI